MKKTQKTYKTRTAKGHILALIESLNTGESFLTKEKPATCQRYAAQYGKKIKTAVRFHVDPKSLETVKVTEVTIN
jgi:hypothetical protein